MLDRIGLMNMAQQLAKHAAARQSVVARNIAHVDTPGYRRQDIAQFSESYRDDRQIAMRATRSGHVVHTQQEFATMFRVVESDTVAPNGNTVSLEDEILNSAEVKQQHDMAISIYQSGLGIIRASIGRR